jgi:hypothetical protein
VSEENSVASDEVREDIGGVETALVLVGREDDDDVGPLGRFCGRQHGETGLLRLDDGLGIGLQADDDLDSGVTQVERVRVAL